MMPPGPESRRNGLWAIVSAALVLLLFAGIISSGKHPRNSGPTEDLQHFAGVIDHTRRSYDHARSDLDVRASRFLESGDAQSAEALYREVIAKYPNDPEVFNALGACLVFQNRFQEAKTNYLHALDLSSQSERALYGLGCVAYYQYRFPEAKDYLEKALLLDQQYGLCHRLLGIIYKHLGDKQNAILHFERALALDPSDVEIKEWLHELK